MSSPEAKHVTVTERVAVNEADNLLPDLKSESKSERQRFSDHLSLKAVTGTAALFLGAIYAYGAIVKAGQLHGADLAVGDTLALVPLEQILVIGINEMLPFGAALAVALLIGLAFLDAETPWEDRPRNPNSDEGLSEKARKRIRWGARIFTGLFWVWVFFAGAWTSWLLIVETTAVAWYAGSEHSTGRSYAIFATTAIALFFAASAYLNPAPLSHITLTKKDGEVVKGDLIATTGSTWYVGLGDKHWTAVQAREIKRNHASAVKGTKRRVSTTRLLVIGSSASDPNDASSWQGGGYGPDKGPPVTKAVGPAIRP